LAWTDNASLILASKSPRRAEILGDAGIEFTVVSTEIDEDVYLLGADSSSETRDPVEAVRRLALVKARAVATLRSGAFVLGADTIVVLDGEILGKPESAGSAVKMLHRLSGRSHRVITGVTVIDPGGKTHTDIASTSVVFRNLEDGEVVDYVATGSPLDKAGGYGIQDSSFAPVESYDECYLNVVGLPMCVTIRLLEMSGFNRFPAAVCRRHINLDPALHPKAIK